MKTPWFLSTFVLGRAVIARQPQMLQMSAVETGQMSSVETGQMSAVPESSGFAWASGALQVAPAGV